MAEQLHSIHNKETVPPFAFGDFKELFYAGLYLSSNLYHRERD